MKKYLKRLKNPKILIPLLLFIIISIPFVSYALGSLSASRYPNWSKKFKDVAQYSSFGLLKEKEAIKIQDKQEEKSNLITVSPSEIEIVNKRISELSYSGQSEISYMFSALLKNNSQYGIPKIVIKSIKIYDKNNNLIGEKTDYVPMANVTIVKGGEYPFSFEIMKEENDWDPESFDLEITIPDFEINKKAVRLDITKIELVERLDNKALGVLKVASKYRYLNYSYDITIKNNTEKTVSNIYYISFLKYEDFVLSRIEDSCCTRVYFERDKSPISLDEPDTFSILQPGQEETISIKMSPYENLYIKGMNEDNIEMIYYVIGLIQ